jgi:hypothetical protein
MSLKNSLTDKNMLMVSTALALLLMLILIPSAIAVNDTINLKSEINRTYDPQKDSLFDIFASIPKSYEKVEPGTELLTNVKLVNLGSGGRVDVILDYSIKDAGNQELMAKKETVAVETQANFVRTFNLPHDAKPGKYKIYVKIIYADGREAASEASFEIVKAQNQKTGDYFIYGSLAVIVLAILIYVLIKSKAILEKIKMKIQIRRIVKKKLS